jgi:LMBR1 domain-containing protein 1
MVNPVLIIVAVIFLILLAVGNFYILVYFSSEEDKNTAWFPKIIVVFSLTLVCANILMLPLDVANNNNGGLPMEIIWIVAYSLTGALSLVVIPFTIFYYEAEDPTEDNVDQIKQAIFWSLGSLIIFAIVTTILYLTIGVVEVPVTKLFASWQLSDDYTSCNNCTSVPNQYVEYRVSVILYIISMLTIIGVFLFILFGGIGMAALPIDLIYGYRYRPRYMNADEYKRAKAKIEIRVNSLVEKGNKLKDKWSTSGGRPRSRRDKQKYNDFRSDVFLLEEDWKRLDKSYNRGLGPRVLSVVWAWAQLVLGLFSIAISILWIIQVILYQAANPPISPFLNTLFIALDSAFGLFGTVAYGLFSFYLLWTVIKGNFKFGLKIPFIFEIHPMKVGETMMNSFLFNCLLLLFASMAVVQFCTAAFSEYTTFTAIDIIFNVGVRNLEGVRYIWFYYYWVWICLAILSGVFLIIFPGKIKNQRRKRKKDPLSFVKA